MDLHIKKVADRMGGKRGAGHSGIFSHYTWTDLRGAGQWTGWGYTIKSRIRLRLDSETFRGL